MVNDIEIPEFVAEFTTNHMGHLGLLLRMVKEAKYAQADSIKMQKKDVETFYTQDKLDSLYESPFGKTYRDYRNIFELTHNAWQQFDGQCDALDIPWFVTVQDSPSFEYMQLFKLERYKIASSNARDIDFLRELSTGISCDHEIVVSVGGCTLDEIEHAINTFSEFKCIYLLHCVAEYPCQPESLRLGNIPELIKRFGDDRIKIGYSGHEIGYKPSVVAAQLGAKMIERHFCISRHSFVHHIECSLEPDEFSGMVHEATRCVLDGRDDYQVELPDEAFKCEFGMSERERAFLVEQSYGNKFLAGGKSELR